MDDRKKKLNQVFGFIVGLTVFFISFLSLHTNNLDLQKYWQVRKISNPLVLAKVCDVIVTAKKIFLDENAPMTPLRNVTCQITRQCLLSKDKAECVMVTHEDLDPFEGFIRTIDRPQNVHCVHGDEKATSAFKDVTTRPLRCFANAFQLPKGTWDLCRDFQAQADLDYLRGSELLKLHGSTSNTGGQDFPLKTSKEVVWYLKGLKGKKNNSRGAASSYYKKDLMYALGAEMEFVFL